MHESDRETVARVASGGEEGFRALVERHSRYLYHVAFRLTGQAMDAEDVVQDTFLKAHRQWRQFEGRADVRTWLHRIAVNCAIDLIRARRHRELGTDPADLETAGRTPMVAGLPPPDRVVEGRQIGAKVAEALGALTALERAAFTLRHVEGLSIREIGESLGLKSEATKHSIFRAVRKMRVALEPLMETRTRGGAARAAQG
ncbi:MAG: RNA polymerase sigma factor [Vicinamibacterales bacterium]|nr:RNA polymerase sigma factor [Vicinamibacterales bacterium]